MLSWLLLSTLTAAAIFAALGVAVRAKPEGRAEAGILVTAIFHGIICTPILALGHLSLLRPSLLAPASVVVSAAAFLASARGRSLVEHVREVARMARELSRVPKDAFALVLRARSFALLGLVGATIAVVASAWLAWLAPSESWDGFFYHEPMVGYAIQNHGFRVVDLPNNMVVQATNGYPRLCEAFALWFVIFTDKTLIEIGNTVAAPGLMLAVYVLAKRYCPDPTPLLGWSTALLLMPAMLTQMRTSMIDVQVAFFLVTAIHYATRPVQRLRDVAVASLCMALIVGSKSPGLAWVPPLAVVTYGRAVLAHRRQRARAAWLVAASGSALIAGVAALTFVRNWRAFHNPLWPVSYDNAWLDIHWPGLVKLAQITPNPPLQDLVSLKYARPIGGVSDIIARDYGYGVPWVVVPLAAVSLAFALVTAVRARLARSPDAAAENLLLVAALGAAFVIGSPSLNIARFNAHIIAIGMVSIAWTAGRLRDTTRFHEGAIAATLLMTLVPMFWTNWFFGRSVKDMWTLLRCSSSERATMNVESFEMPPDIARKREQELGRGDLVVFTQELAFPGVLWNRDMSNRVQYVSFNEPTSFLTDLDRLRPTWVVVGVSSAARATLDKRSADWEHVGTAVQQDWTVVYRRRAR